MKNDTIDEIINCKKSIFVSANAGSGKTFALVTRVLALLIEGLDPKKILCITFTKAAANEMLERLKKILKQWQNLEDFSKDPILSKLPPHKQLKAKLLYQNTVIINKMPKILTIHSFALEVLSTFSLEAEVFEGFSILSNLQDLEIKEKVLKEIILNKETRDLIKTLSVKYKISTLISDTIPELLCNKYELFFNTKDIKLQSYEALNLKYLEGSLNEISTKLDKEFLDKVDINSLSQMLKKLEKLELSKTDLQAVDNIKTFIKDPIHNISSFINVFLTQDFNPRTRIFTKNVITEVEDYVDQNTNLCEKFALKKLNYEMAKITEIISLLAAHIIKNYENEKDLLKSYTFDDLIKKVDLALRFGGLGDRDFILFKLDGGISHILVDEAQDTNLKQWGILFAILEEFFAYGSSHEQNKTLFIVGDEKQSIYSFQGAEPDVLKSILNKYKANVTQLSLEKSYRSSGAVLNVVDKIFNTNHICAREKEDYGKVEVLEPPIFEPSAKKIGWQMPWEDTEEDSINKVSAKQIALKVLDIIKEERFLPKHNRTLKPKDIILLIRSRDAGLFKEIVKELKKHSIDASFIDDITYKESLPIQDFIYTLKYTYWSSLGRENLYALCCILKSPMFGLTEEDLEDIIINKTKSIPFNLEQIKSWDMLNLEDFFILLYNKFYFKYTAHQRRHLMQIFNIIKNYKLIDKVPNVEGFLQYFTKIENETFKISIEDKEDAIKISTIHGAKGMEFPVIMLLNSEKIYSKSLTSKPFVFNKKDLTLLFAVSQVKPERWKQIKDIEKAEELEEYMRLLYVALTRAEDEIYIFTKPKLKEIEDEDKSFYSVIKKALFSICNSNSYEVGKKILQKQNFYIDTKESKKIPVSSKVMGSDKTNQIFQTATKRASNYHLGLDFGRAMHTLLQLKKEVKYEEKIALIKLTYPKISTEKIIELIDKAEKVKSLYPHYFTPNTLSEVEVSVALETGEILIGKIDKLIITETEIEVIDFKYYQIHEMTIDIEIQLTRYKKAIEKIYPTHNVKTKVIWI